MDEKLIPHTFNSKIDRVGKWVFESAGSKYAGYEAIWSATWEKYKWNATNSSPVRPSQKTIHCFMDDPVAS